VGQGAGLDNLWDIATQKCRNTMPCTAELRSDKSPILPCSGVLTRKELIDVKRRLVTDQNRELRYVIGDLTPVTDIHISAPEFRAIVDEDRRLAAIAQPGMPVSVVTSDDLGFGFGLARMWEVFASELAQWQIMW